MPRAKRLSTAEAADRLGVSERQMRALAKSHWIGKKEGGAWTFTETEIRKLDQERKDHQKAIKLRKRLETDLRRLKGLPPKRKKRKSGQFAATRTNGRAGAAATHSPSTICSTG
jgi:hypothetical protein